MVFLLLLDETKAFLIWTKVSRSYKDLIGLNRNADCVVKLCSTPGFANAITCPVTQGWNVATWEYIFIFNSQDRKIPHSILTVNSRLQERPQSLSKPNTKIRQTIHLSLNNIRRSSSGLSKSSIAICAEQKDHKASAYLSAA